MNKALLLTTVLALLSGCAKDDGAQKTLGSNSWRGLEGSQDIVGAPGPQKAFSVSGALTGAYTVNAGMGNICQGTITFSGPVSAATAYESTGTYAVTALTLSVPGAYSATVDCSQYAEAGSYVHRGNVYLCKGNETLNCAVYR